MALASRRMIGARGHPSGNRLFAQSMRPPTLGSPQIRVMARGKGTTFQSPDCSKNLCLSHLHLHLLAEESEFVGIFLVDLLLRRTHAMTTLELDAQQDRLAGGGRGLQACCHL